jgi:hypothetical protein
MTSAHTPRGEDWHWMTTYPSGRAHTHGADDGQTGWRIHLVDRSSLKQQKRFIKHYGTGLVDVMQGPALCGMRPGTGWGMDLFIDRPCARCERAAEKRGIELPEIPR